MPSALRSTRALASLLAVLIASAALLKAAPVLPVPVPYENFEDAPYRWVGLVRTDSVGADPTVLGTGWVAGSRVVVSAAHVFFVDETLGWNRNRWYFRRAARPEDFWKTDEARRPRAFRALAGYAAAAERSVSDTSAFHDALNRDTVALLFYPPVISGPPAERVVDGLSGPGVWSIVGYPALLNGRPSEALARLYAHVGGQTGTFARTTGKTEDYLGNPMQLFRSSDLMSGPGGSGGPVFRLREGQWEVAGVLLAGASDYSSIIARSIDAQADELIAQAIADSAAPTAGRLLWQRPFGISDRTPICRPDGSIVFLGNTPTDGLVVQAIDSAGESLWKTRLDMYDNPTLAERPDGNFVVMSWHTAKVIDGGSGRVLAYFGGPGPGSASEFAIGPVGEVYSASSYNGSVSRLSPRGEAQWTKKLGDSTTSMGPAVGADGTVYAVNNNRIFALAPTDGAVRWMSEPLQNLMPWSLSVRTDGGLTVLGGGKVHTLAADGSLRWSTTVEGSGVEAPLLAGDGSLFVLSQSTRSIHVLDADGVRRREIPVNPDRLKAFTVDAAGTAYIATDARLEAVDAQGNQVWIQDTGAHGIALAAGNRLAVVSTDQSTLSIFGTDAGRHDATWERGRGGADRGRRAANALPVAPYFVRSPDDKRIVAGYRLELEADAEGSHPLTFEWRRDGVLLPEQVGQRLSIRATTKADSGLYTVTARNLAGTITTAGARITVDEAQFGDVLWTTQLRLKSAAAIADDGTVYALVGVQEPPVSLVHYHLVALSPFGEELWRLPLGIAYSEDTTADMSDVVLGEEGQLFFATPGMLWCVNADGTVRWKQPSPSNSSQYTADLSLGPGRTVYAANHVSISLYDYEGHLGWREAASPSSGFPGSVRRDGVYIPRYSGRYFRPDGTSGALPPGLDTASVIGPNDEITHVIYPDSITTWNAQWTRISENTASPAGSVGVVCHLENLDLACSGSAIQVARFLGDTTRIFPTTGSYITPIAALEGNRLIAFAANVITAHQHTGELLGTLTLNSGTRSLSRWGAFTVGRQAQLICGPWVTSYSVKWPLASSPWPCARADSRNTSRAPGTFALTRDQVFRIDIDGPAKGYVGYATTLRARILGAAGTMQWFKDGVPLAGARSAELSIASTSFADAGTYKLVVTTAAGSFSSASLHVPVVQPEPAAPGFFVGRWKNPSAGDYVPYALTTRDDGSIELIISGPEGRHVTSKLNADGTFVLPGTPPIAGRILNGALTFTSGTAGSVLPMPAPATGLAPNGVPAGIYRGRAVGETAWPGSALVFADGTIALTPAWKGGRALTQFTSFAGTERTLSFPDDPAIAWTYLLTIEAETTGVLRGKYVGYSAERPEFVLLWSGRPAIERLVNISTRGFVSPDLPPMIVGFVVSGSADHRLLLRGAGPGLALLGVSQALPAPSLQFVDRTGGEIARNSGWSQENGEAIRLASMRLGAFPFAPGSKDCALLHSVPPALYTMLVSSGDGASGIALVEAYEDVGENTPLSRLANLSTRGTAGSGDRALIAGFVIVGPEPKTVLIRAAGPALRPLVGDGFPLAANPKLDVYRQGNRWPIASNDDWGTNVVPDLAEVANRVGAFAFAAGSLDAALLLNLPPGIYTANVTNYDAGTGVALLELYEISP